MFLIGCHLSNAKGYLAMAKDAQTIGANTAQFFTRNPRGGRAKPLDLEDITAFHAFTETYPLHLLAHAPYTLNACAADPNLRQFAVNTMSDDLARLEYFPGCCYNFHPGSHVKQGVEQGIIYIANLLNEVLIPEQHTVILLETMAGKGTEVGRQFEELRAIIDRVTYSDRIGICLDTCHVWDSGYDIVHQLDAILDELNQIIGLSRLKAIHLNDSLNPCGSRKDRHAKIGTGEIGLNAIAAVINHPKLCTLPFYLETPNDLDGYGKEIQLLRSLYQK
ncbi:MAG: deoxyribonuclease IV [Oscillospiraceae bacterium]|nr:deoxyribonuclease IV [Oscillospiraceae bacterium]